MNIYVFGNKDHQEDSIALKILDQIQERFNDIHFIIISDPQSEFEPKERVPIIIDAAEGINDVVLIESLDQIDLPHTSSMHDFDLGFNLKFMKKIGRIDSAKIIALPFDHKDTMEVTNAVINFIRKLQIVKE